jgi:hypothetical protein
VIFRFSGVRISLLLRWRVKMFRSLYLYLSKLASRQVERKKQKVFFGVLENSPRLRTRQVEKGCHECMCDCLPSNVEDWVDIIYSL